MNSQLTLVDSTSAPDTCTTLFFDRRDMKYATLSHSQSGERVYKFDSDKSASQTTVYRYPEATVLATLERRQILPNTISFQGAAPVKVSKWLKSNFLGGLPAAFVEEGRKYTWKITSFMYHLALFEDRTPVIIPIAWFQPSQKRVVDGVPVLHPPCLSLTPEAEQIQDSVVISLLIAYEMAKGTTQGL